jgi:hypothetical protein
VISRTGEEGFWRPTLWAATTRVIARNLSSSHNQRVAERSYEAHATYDVPQQRWQEEAHKIRLDSHAVAR